MKVLYRCPYKINHQWLLMITLLAIVILVIVDRPQPISYQQQMQQATELTRQGGELIIQRKRELGLAEPIEDAMPKHPLLGSWLTTPVTSVFGHLSAKEASLNPRFGALIYRWLKELDVKKGDYVAVSASGSFPALNLATYSALKTIGAKPLIILSLTASQWGANQPELMWIDMGNLLLNQNLVTFRPMAVSYGAKEDKAENLSPTGIAMLKAAIARNGNPPLIYTDSLLGNIDEKWQRFTDAQQQGQQPIKAFINIGGGKSSVGSIVDKKLLFKSGVNRTLPEGSKVEIPGLMWRFISNGVPVIHLSGINKIVAANQQDLTADTPMYVDTSSKHLSALLGLMVLLSALFGAAYVNRKRDKVVSL